MTDVNNCASLIKQIHSELEKNSNNALRKDDLTLAQISVLLTLSEREENQMEQKQLEKSMHIAQSTVTGIVKRLEQKGFIESFTSSEDKRIKMIRITSLGLEYCKKAEINMKKAEKDLTSTLTENEYDTLLYLLQKIRNSFS